MKNTKFLIFNFIFAFFIFNLAFTCLAQESSKEIEALYVAKKAFDDGFYDVSLGLLERFLQNYHNSQKEPEAQLLIGQCYFHQHKFLEALAKFESLLSKAQAAYLKDAVFYWIAEVHFKGNNFSKAAEYYKSIIESHPKSSYLAHAYYSMGWCLFQQYNYKEALKYFAEIQSRYPKENLAQDASFKVLECLYNLKDYEGLKAKIKPDLKLFANDAARGPYLYFYLAEADYYLNNFQDAITSYSKVAAITSDERMQALSRLSIGWAYLKLKQYKPAQEAFAQVKTGSLEKKNQEVLKLGEAILAFETSRFKDAKDIYSGLANTAQDPVILVQSYLGWAETLYNMSEYEGSMAAYKSALDKFKHEAVPQEFIDKLHYGLAWVFLKEGMFKEAIDEFQRVAKNTEDKIIKVSALCQMGDAYQDSGEYSKAVSAYNNILRDYPDSFYGDYVQYQLGLTLLKASNYDGAIIAFKNLMTQYPASKLLDDADYALGLAYFQREDYESSRDIFEAFVTKFKDSNLNAQAIYLLGTSYYNLGKFAKAIEVYKDILRMYNQDIELCQKAEYEIADCLYQMGDEKEAMNRFKILRSKYPDSSLTAEVMWWLGEYYYRHNDLGLARRYFSSLIQDYPKSNLIPDAYYVLGLTFDEDGRYEEAVDNFKKVISLGRSDLAGQAAIVIADISLKQGKYDAAMASYNEAAKNYPNLVNLIYPKIAEAHENNGDYQGALDFYRRSLEAVPLRQMADIQFKIAEVYESQGNLPAAIEEYLKVSYLYTQNNNLVAKSLLRVASIYENQEGFKEALSIYKRISAMDVQEAKYAQERIDWIKNNIK